MYYINQETINKAQEQAIYNIYLYLCHKITPANHQTLRSIVMELEKDQTLHTWKQRDILRLDIIKAAIANNTQLAYSKIGNYISSENGLTACTFTKPNGDISVVFKGTGSGEWIDNGEGLSGIPEENTYIFYDNSGKSKYKKTVKNDYATDQQVEALNWFNQIEAENSWTNDTVITVSGHSKGGNKAQFVCMHTSLADRCYSFDGQGFSPEALSALQKQYKTEYEERRYKIHSFATDNDYVNVLGERLVPKNQIYYFKPKSGLHYIEAMLDKTGNFNLQCEQGKLSKYVETVSKELMSMKPSVRQYATLGVMNIFQKHLGQGIPVNNDSVSIEKTIAGIGITVNVLLHKLRR